MALDISCIPKRFRMLPTARLPGVACRMRRGKYEPKSFLSETLRNFDGGWGGTRIPALFRWVQHKFLHAPVQQFCDEEHILGWAGDLVNPAKLLQLFSGFA